MYKIVAGSEPYKNDVTGFRPVSEGGTCLWDTMSVNCTAIFTGNLPWNLHGSQNYFITIKASNPIGLYALAVSDVYVHNVYLASEGVVFDINPSSSQQVHAKCGHIL